MEDRTLNILYGDKGYKLNLNSHWNPNIIRKPQMPIISNLDKKIEEIFEKPKDSSNIESLAKLAKSVCILVCDITRPVPNKLFIETLINKLIKYGINKDKILILIATGLHRPATKNEINQIIGSNWVVKNISIKNHYARDDNMHSNLGVTTKNNVIKLDKRFLQSDLKIATGLVEPHFMAGYSGGRKIIAPGIAHAETITRFHSAKYMENKYSKSCNLYKNPLHEDQLEIVKMIGDVYAVNCVIDENRELSFINFGEIINSHLKAINFISNFAKVKCTEKYNTIVTSSAGSPLDSTFYQTVKGMVTPLEVLKDNGDIIIISQCSEGLGSEEFKNSQLKLIEIGPKKFIKDILNKNNANIDEWQTEMEIKSLNKGNIYLFSEGLSSSDKRLTGVNIINNIEDAINKSITRHNNSNIAIIPEGPYVIPTL